MKICVISDIHSNLAAFQAVLKHLPKCDVTVCVGDLVGYAAEPNEVVDLVRSKNMKAVLGNHDYGVISRDTTGFNTIAAKAVLWTTPQLKAENARYLRGLPEELKFTCGGKKVVAVHGSPRDPLFEYIFPDISNHELFEVIRDVDADVLIIGHTHVPMVRTIQGKLVVNPGSVGQPRDWNPRASYMVLTIDDEVKVEHERVEYDIEKTAAKIKAAGLPDELAMRLHFGW